MSIIIRNGIIVSDTSQWQGDIFVENGIIKRVAEKLPDELKADEEINADGFYVLPGGIDPHVHMHLPTAAGYSSDDFYTGSRAALSGGTTTIIDFVTPKRGESIPEAFEKRKNEAAKVLTNCFFHVSPVEFTQKTKEELIKCMESGIKSFKVYMAYKTTIGLRDDELQQVLDIIGKAGGVVAVHCEMGDKIETLRDQFFLNGQIEPRYHALSRPPETESEAIKKILDMASKSSCPLYLVHISSANSLKYIEEARKTGQTVFAETCPQYLLLTEEKYQGSFYQTAPYVMSPPLRSKNDCEALWNALSDGIIQSVGTDHCPFFMSQKEQGINDFRKIPNGAGGVEHRMALLFTYGVLKKRISLQQFVNLTSTMPAKIFGLYPRKGIITENADADIVIWNPDIKREISAKNHQQRCDHNIYEGLMTQGRPEFVIKSGNVVVYDGNIITEP